MYTPDHNIALYDVMILINNTYADSPQREEVLKAISEVIYRIEEERDKADNYSQYNEDAHLYVDPQDAHLINGIGA